MVFKNYSISVLYVFRIVVRSFPVRSKVRDRESLSIGPSTVDGLARDLPAKVPPNTAYDRHFRFPPADRDRLSSSSVERTSVGGRPGGHPDRLCSRIRELEWFIPVGSDFVHNVKHVYKIYKTIYDYRYCYSIQFGNGREGVKPTNYGNMTVNSVGTDPAQITHPFHLSRI
jgi:hypothetical protein